MPLKSKKQMRWMFAAESRGELPKGTARTWTHHTPDKKSLPLYARKKKNTKKANLELMAAAGNLSAANLIQVLKEAAIGRHEGFGATNGAMTANSNLLSPTTLARPPAPTVVGGGVQPVNNTLPGLTPLPGSSGGVVGAASRLPGFQALQSQAAPPAQASPKGLNPIGYVPANGLTSLRASP